MSVGAEGVISVASNVAPRDVKQMVDLANSNDFKAATIFTNAYTRYLLPFSSRAIPCLSRQCLMHQGTITDDIVRLPLAPLSEDSMNLLSAVTHRLGLTS